MLSVSSVNVFPNNPRLAALIEEHNDLDEAVSVLMAAGTSDDLLLNRLKKRKLRLKDEIASGLAHAANTPDEALTG